MTSHYQSAQRNRHDAHGGQEQQLLSYNNIDNDNNSNSNSGSFRRRRKEQSNRGYNTEEPPSMSSSSSSILTRRHRDNHYEGDGQREIHDTTTTNDKDNECLRGAKSAGSRHRNKLRILFFSINRRLGLFVDGCCSNDWRILTTRIAFVRRFLFDITMLRYRTI